MSIPPTALTVYNAAAGAGKTYTLVLKYLATLLKGEFTESYSTILAITFTNKAVAEMKTRVLENLRGLSAPSVPETHQQLLVHLEAETGMDAAAIQHKSRRILKSILHNYAAFDIVTIDTFTHRVIRTFAHDLGIPVNFEIEMEIDTLIAEAVDAVIAKIGVDPKTTQIILDFAIRKLEEDKSWDIAIALNAIAKLLFSENDREPLQQLLDKTPEDFEGLKHVLYTKVSAAKKEIIEEARQILTLLETKGIAPNAFPRSSIPKHFQKLADGDTTLDTKTVWKQNIQTTAFYNKSADEGQKAAIDEIRPKIEAAFSNTHQLLIALALYENVVQNIIPLSVLHSIQQELQHIKTERKILLISEFNSIISEAIKEQPAPFIYERLGERYRDYFIDEFQDTSELQWTNMIPLIDNAIATETLSGKRGQLTIVGDAKQAIYRWRGGKAEQFIALSGSYTPFSVPEKAVIDLPRNYRSHAEIVQFNNNLFTFLAKDLSDPTYQELYIKGNQQEINSKQGGYVELSFITAKNVAEEHEIYPEKVVDAIQALLAKGYAYREMCILTRRQKEGVQIADYLTSQGIAITSSETLLLANSPSILFSIDLLTWYIQPQNTMAKVNVLHYIMKRFEIQDQHSFLAEHIHEHRYAFSNTLKTFGIDFSFSQLATRPLYDAVAYIVHAFDLASESPAHIQFFLDAVFAFVSKDSSGGVLRFLTYWERKKKTLSVVAPDGEDAIRIMTIHKAKGLEFPCVIYPYADVDLYREIEPKAWLPVAKGTFQDFDSVYINYSSAMENYGETAAAIVRQRRAQLELDAYNVLYVALTRAVEQLYIISKMGKAPKKDTIPNTFSGKLIQYLEYTGQWNSDQYHYSFGETSFSKRQQETPLKQEIKGKPIKKHKGAFKKYSINIVTNAVKVWDQSRQEAMAKGTIIHDIMALIHTVEDVDFALETAQLKGWITGAQSKEISKEIVHIVTHPQLARYYTKAYTIYNERDIIDAGTILRPDRIVCQGNTVTIMDYKTGAYYESHAQQLRQYEDVLLQMGYQIDQKILIYMGAKFTLKFM